jgi:hypothetical protein
MIHRVEEEPETFAERRARILVDKLMGRFNAPLPDEREDEIEAGKAMTVWMSVWARPTFVDALTRAEDGAARAKVWNDVASMMGIKLTDEDHAELETMWNA